MLIRPWDSPVDPGEWRTWLPSSAPFGELVVNNLDPDEAPIVLPTHVALEGERLLAHLAVPNPAWPHLERARRVRFSVSGDEAYVPGTWRAAEGVPAREGVPTSYYAAVQLVCAVEIVDDPEAKAEILRIQMRHSQPEGGSAEIVVGEGPYGKMLAGIRALRLPIVEIAAKFKFDDHKPLEMRERIAAALDARGRPHDAAARHQRRRIEAAGAWDPRSRG
jgi:transcriptional regulator